MNDVIHTFDQIHHLTQDRAICKYRTFIFVLFQALYDIYLVRMVNFSEVVSEQISDYTRSQQKRGFAELIMIYSRYHEGKLQNH